MRKPLLFLAVAALAATAVLTAACGDDDDDAGDDGGGAGATATATATTNDDGGGDGDDQQTVAIDAEGFAFLPAEIAVRDGATVTVVFRNEDSASHSLTIGDEDVVVAAAGAEAEGTFTASETTTEFHCKFHSQMTGTITISEDAASANDEGGGNVGGGYGY